MEQVVRLEILGKSTEEIATVVGVTASTLHSWTSKPEYEKIRQRVVDKIYGPLDKTISTRKAADILETAAPEAADALSELLDSTDEVTRRISATAILDRTGHGPVQRRATRVRHEIDPTTAKLLADALSESTPVPLEAHVVDDD